MRKETMKFIDYNKLFCNALYKEHHDIDVEEIEYNEYLSDNNQIKEKMLKIMNEPGQHFVSAQTGSGKTYSVIDCFKTIAAAEKNPALDDVMEWVQTIDNEKLKNDCLECEALAKDLYCAREGYMKLSAILVPARSQTLQAAEEYEIKAIVGDNENNKLDIFNDQTIVSVYDKATELYETIDKCSNIKVRLVIDESHLLCMARFRSKAIEDLEKLIDLVLRKNGSVIYLTASYMAMIYLRDLKSITFCNKKNTERNFKEINLYVNTKGRKMQDFVYDVLKDKRGLVRYNNKEIQKSLAAKLEEDNKTVYYLNADEKQGITDKTTNKTVYKNKMLDSVVNYSQLPAADYCIPTSLLDAGTNIKSVDGKQDPDFLPFYVIDNTMNMNLLSIEQFSNRLRYNFDSYNILINDKVVTNSYNFSLEQIIEFQTKQLETQLEYLKLEEQILKTVLYRDREDKEEATERAILNLLECENNFDDLKNSYGGSITYSKEQGFEVEYKYFLNYCLERYYLTLYYNRDLFINELLDLFEVNVNIIENIESAGENISEAYKAKHKEEVLNYFMKNKELPEKTDPELIRLMNRYEKAFELDSSNAKMKVLANPSDLINELLDNKCQSVLKSISGPEKKVLQEVLKGDKLTKEIKNNTFRRHIETITENKKMKEKIQKGLKKGLDLDEVIEAYDINNDKALTEYIKQKQIVENNNKFMIDKHLLYDHASYDQCVVLDFINNVKNYQIYEKRREETKEDKIDELIKLLNDKTGHEYTRKKLINFIKMIYNFREETEKSGKKVIKVIYLNSLKTKM